jgi:phage terminase large subunit GpA-like protein
MTPDVRNADDTYREAARNAARREAGLRVSEWADQNRILSTRSSPEPGLWRTSRTPFLAYIMDALGASSPL